MSNVQSMSSSSFTKPTKVETSKKTRNLSTHLSFENETSSEMNNWTLKNVIAVQSEE